MTTNRMTLSLIDVVKKKEDFGRLQGYWNTYHCQSKIYTADGKLHGRYCKNRSCLLCLSIRKADIINRYLPTISTWPDPQFVTITAKSVPLNRIAKRMKSLLNGFQKVTGKHRKRAQRGNGKKLKLVVCHTVAHNDRVLAKAWNCCLSSPELRPNK